MRYLFFANTPAHVHLYKYAVAQLSDRGHDVLVMARDYGCTVDLLEWYDLPHRVYGYCDTTKGSLLYRLPGHYVRSVLHAWRFDPDLIFGMGGYAAHTGAVLRTPTVLLLDSESTGIDHAVSTPFARAVLTPDTFRKRLDDDHYVFSGFKECAYLHPGVYARNPSIRNQLGLAPDEEYAVVRLNAFGSHHDVGEDGFTEERRRELVETLSDRATVLISDEAGDLDCSDLPARAYDLHPALLHDALAEASLLVADTQTMVTEAALLGTPAIRSNSFVGESDMGNFLELEDRGLIYNVAAFEDVLDRATELLEADGIGEKWERKRNDYLDELVDLTGVIVDVATREGRAEDVDALRPFGQPRSAEVPEPVPVESD